MPSSTDRFISVSDGPCAPTQSKAIKRVLLWFSPDRAVALKLKNHGTGRLSLDLLGRAPVIIIMKASLIGLL